MKESILEYKIVLHFPGIVFLLFILAMLCTVSLFAQCISISPEHLHLEHTWIWKLNDLCLNSGSRITCQTSVKIIALGYVVALLWAVMPLIGFGSYDVEPYGLSCTLNWMSNDTGKFTNLSIIQLDLDVFVAMPKLRIPKSHVLYCSTL